MEHCFLSTFLSSLTFCFADRRGDKDYTVSLKLFGFREVTALYLLLRNKLLDFLYNPVKFKPVVSLCSTLGPESCDDPSHGSLTVMGFSFVADGFLLSIDSTLGSSLLS